MRREYHRWRSHHLGHDMELLLFGHAGTPMLVFPTSMGAFHEYEDRGMIAAVADKLESGALQLFCVASVDRESFLELRLDVPLNRPKRATPVAFAPCPLWYEGSVRR